MDKKNLSKFKAPFCGFFLFKTAGQSLSVRQEALEGEQRGASFLLVRRGSDVWRPYRLPMRGRDYPVVEGLLLLCYFNLAFFWVYIHIYIYKHLYTPFFIDPHLPGEGREVVRFDQSCPPPPPRSQWTRLALSQVQDRSAHHWASTTGASSQWAPQNPTASVVIDRRGRWASTASA